ncbi:hypothetical protein DFH06DRAFT_1149041 [Mycena polygramma]|nr:hypothetical protein DFH06DRAFT_1149041 [Mycena polygramma]
MDSGIDPNPVASSAATAPSEYVSAMSTTGPLLGTTSSTAVPSTDTSANPGARSPETRPVPSTPVAGGSPNPDAGIFQYLLYHDDEGRPYLRDSNGVRYTVSAVGPSSDRNYGSSPSGIPMHHSVLFSTEPSTESALSASSPERTSAENYPALALDIDPNILSSDQISQLNAIRGHLGTANSRVLAATAIIAEHQAATEDVHEVIQALRGEVLTRVDSLRNEVNSQRSRLNRVLDNNLKLVVETGASGAQVKDLLLIMNRNGGAHRSDRPAPTMGTPVVAPMEPLPAEIRTAVDAVVPPRMDGETSESSSAQRATRAFESVAWNPLLGPEKLYSDLKECGERMVEAPSLFTFRHRFLQALPKRISNELRLHRGVTAEFSDHQLMRSHARQMWEVDNAIRMEAADDPTAGGSGRTRNYAGSRRHSERHSGDRAERTAPRPATGTTSTDRALMSRRDERDCRDDKDRPRSDKPPAGKPSTTAGCFNCGGTDHYAWDKACPKYDENHKSRDRPRVAAQRVLESYSDEDTDSPSSDDDSESSAEEHDPKAAPDLDTLLAIAESNDNDVRVASMRERSRVHYYSMRVVEAEDDSESESSITASSLSDSEGDVEDTPSTRTPTPVPFGYNPGPVCVVCHDCALIVRQVPATAANGLITDREYTVCEHLASVGIDTSPDVPEESQSVAPTIEEAVTFEGYDLNALGEPDFEAGVIMDITSPMEMGFQSAADELFHHEQARSRQGMRSLTALEYDTNLRWLSRYRLYENNEPDPSAIDWEETQRASLLQDPVYGVVARAHAMLEELRVARIEEARLNELGPGTPWTQEPVQRIVSAQLGEWAPVHEYNLRAQDVLRQATSTRRLARSIRAWMEVISTERRDVALSGRAEALWDAAYWEARELSARVSQSMEESQIALITAKYLRDESRKAISARIAIRAGMSQEPHLPARFPSLIHPFDSHLAAREDVTAGAEAIRETVGLSPFQFYSPPPLPAAELAPAMRRSPGVVVVRQENIGVIPVDEAGYWVESTPLSGSEILGLAAEAPIVESGPTSPSAPINNDRDDTPPSPVTLTDEEEYNINNPGGYTWAQEQYLREQAMDEEQERGHAWSDVKNFDPYTSRFIRAGRVELDDGPPEKEGDLPLDPSPVLETNPIVRESYDATLEEVPVCPRASDELLFTAVRLTGKREAERVYTMLDSHGNVYWKSEDLPRDHFLHPEFRGVHETAISTAILEHARGHPENAGARIVEDPPRSDCATQGSTSTNKPRSKVLIEEEEEEEIDVLPTLPADYLYCLETEEDAIASLNKDDPVEDKVLEEIEESNAHEADGGDDSADSTDEAEFFDAQDLDYEPCAECEQEDEAAREKLARAHPKTQA